MRRLAAILIGLFVALPGAELAVRALGYRAWRATPQGGDQPPLHEPDPELGWRNKAGSVEWAPRVPGQRPIRMTFWKGGLRATAPERVARDRRMLVLGGSFSQGWAVSDRSTYAWRLQRAFPSVEILNLGTAAYGTYQSLLAFERHLAEGNPPPERVLYGFADFHEDRNVAPSPWLRNLAEISDHIAVNVPYADLEGDALRRHPPAGYSDWPFREWSALITLVESRLHTLSTRGRARQALRVTQRLLVELDERVSSSGAELLVVLLWKTPLRNYGAWMLERGIDVVDCTHVDFASMKVAGYGHPNAALHRHWAQCIERALAERGMPLAREGPDKGAAFIREQPAGR